MLLKMHGRLINTLIASLIYVGVANASGTYSSCGTGWPTPIPTATTTPAKPQHTVVVVASPESSLLSSDLRACVAYETTGGKLRLLRSNWRIDGFLWKPVAEHRNRLVIVVNPKYKVRKVLVQSTQEPVRRRRLSFTSSSGVGDLFRDARWAGSDYEKHFGPITVTLYGPRIRTFGLTCPSQRSDSVNKQVHTL